MIKKNLEKDRKTNERTIFGITVVGIIITVLVIMI
jgi:hypothetical protein